jgi:hypothetical protein
MNLKQEGNDSVVQECDFEIDFEIDRRLLWRKCGLYSFSDINLIIGEQSATLPKVRR